MAITPKEREDRRLERLNKITEELSNVPDYLERLIDEKLKTPSLSSEEDIVTISIDTTDFIIDASLYKKPSIQKDLKQRYINKGWQDMKFEEGRKNDGTDFPYICADGTRIFMTTDGTRFLLVRLIKPGTIVIPGLIGIDERWGNASWSWLKRAHIFRLLILVFFLVWLVSSIFQYLVK